MKHNIKDIHTIIIHGSFTKASQNYTAEMLERDHNARGISSPMGYHYYIRRDGTRIKGRELSRRGAHAAPENTNTIGICLEGGMREDFNGNYQDQSNWEDNYTEEQHAECMILIKDIVLELSEAGNNIRNLYLKGHCDVEGVTKKCPAFNVLDKYGWIFA